LDQFGPVVTNVILEDDIDLLCRTAAEDEDIV
jgi:hypothetical protein